MRNKINYAVIPTGITAFLILSLGTSLFAAPTVLPLKDYLKAIVKNDVSYTNLFHELKNTDGQIKALYAMYDWRFSASASVGKQDEMLLGSFRVADNSTTQWGLGLSKKLESTGTQVDLGFAENDSSATYYIPTALPFANYRPAYTLRLTQPILGDWMGALSHLPLEKIAIQKDIASLSESENEENYFEQALDLYYDWLSLTNALEPLKESYDNSKELLNVVQQQYNNQFASKGDLLRAQEAVLAYQNALMQTLFQWNRVYAEINQKTGNTVAAASSWENLPQVPEINLQQYQIPSDSSGVLRSTSVVQKLIETVQTEMRENEMKKSPQAAVFGEVAAYKNATAATDPFSSIDKKDTRLGVNLSMSLEQSEGNGRNLVLQEKISQTQQNLEELRRKINLIFKTNQLKAETWQKLLENAEKISNYSRERLKLETESYRLGKAPLRDVVDFRNQYVKNKTDALNLQIELGKLRVALASINDGLLDQVKQQIKE